MKQTSNPKDDVPEFSAVSPGRYLPVILETDQVVAVKDVPPAVDVNNASCYYDEEHQCELHHVTDLNQHGGGHEG